ncbi:hypothetical protein MNV49_006848 [Pseudohyphozyma bogoriensis]|nr:hypothetical protein MNV49_006848 [Pseudohyphozyma bogoriensis]
MTTEEIIITPSPSLYGKSDVPIAPVSRWQMGSIASCHVFPGPLDMDRFKQTVADLASLYPVVCGRLQRREGPDGFEYFIALNSSPIKVTIDNSASTSPPFPTNAVIQPTTFTYIDNVDPATQLNNPDAPLLSIRITNFPSGQTVLGLCWAHIVGDGNAFATFTKTFSDLYAGARVDECEQPTFEPHADLLEPTKEMLEKHEFKQLYPYFDLAEGWGIYGKTAQESEEVQVTFTAEEMKLFKSLARGEGEDEWVSEQDGLSSYWVNILRLCDVEVNGVINSINYRHHFPNHPRFPPNLPTLVANVAQMKTTPVPATPPTSLSLKPVALALRKDLEAIKADPEDTVEWLSCRAHRMKQCCDEGKVHVLVPGEGECFVNSNWRYDWNQSFGFPKDSTTFHTSFTILNFLRVFRSNEKVPGAECTWRMTTGLGSRALEEIARDRKEGWVRWK